MKRSVALSFSGGKDSCFALHKLQEMDIDVACLLTTVWKENEQTVAHEESLEEMKAQADRLQIPIHFIVTNFDTYGEDFVTNLEDVKDKYNLNGIAFGDIYIEGHLEWGEKLAGKVGLDPIYPLQNKQEQALDMLKEFVELGFKAEIIKIDKTRLPEEWMGRTLDEEFIEDIVTKDVCPMGESGEYHTRVVDGPIFG